MNNIVSIIVPIYNAEKYLEKCVLSICNQTYQSIEIILIDDYSDDKSLEICMSCKKHDNRIKIKKHSYRQGVSKTRNDGIDAAEGDYLVFIDADDFIEQNFIEMLVQGIKGKELAVCGYYYINESKQQKSYVIEKDKIIDWNSFFFHMFCTNVISGSIWNKLFKKEIVGSIRFNESLMVSEDYVFLMQYIRKCHSFEYIDKALYYYRFHTESMTKKAKRQKYFDVKFMTILDALALMEKLMEEEIYIGSEKYIEYRIVRGAVWLLLQMIYCDYYDKKVHKKIKQNIRRHYHGYKEVNMEGKFQNLAVGISLFSPVLLQIITSFFCKVFPKKFKKIVQLG